MTDKENKVVSLSKVLKNKKEKERELSMYKNHLAMIYDRMAFLEMDRKVTEEIIEMIENDSIVVIDDSVPLVGVHDDDYPDFDGDDSA
jgi:predicted Rossmann fold nucleotide-binding protein DprA/Smf involved in DNA uptake